MTCPRANQVASNVRLLVLNANAEMASCCTQPNIVFAKAFPGAAACPAFGAILPSQAAAS